MKTFIFEIAQIDKVVDNINIKAETPSEAWNEAFKQLTGHQVIKSITCDDVKIYEINKRVGGI